MDWHAAQVSLTLAVLTAGLLLPVGLWLARWLATTHWPGRPLVEALLLLPLLLESESGLTRLSVPVTVALLRSTCRL